MKAEIKEKHSPNLNENKNILFIAKVCVSRLVDNWYIHTCTSIYDNQNGKFRILYKINNINLTPHINELSDPCMTFQYDHPWL